MKALSFLGATKYWIVTYCWQEKECQTELFPQAVAEIFRPEKLFIFVTPTAKKYKPPKGEKCETCGQVLPEPKEKRTYLEVLIERLRHLVEIEVVEIPEGKSEEELWQIFERCAEVVGEGDEILLDITHAFRSLPMVVFTVAAYLRATKKAKISRIVYGAYEARRPLRTPPEPTDKAPIFDLTPLLDLLDWLNGAEFLLRRSDATLLAKRLIGVHKAAWKERTSEDLPKKLEKFGKALEEFSLALHLARPREVMSNASNLLKVLEEVKPEVEKWAKPFGVILEQVKSEAEKFAYATPDKLDEENLKKQLELIRHFVEKELLAQAILLAREWVVSWIALKHGGDWLDKNYREDVIEEALNQASLRLRKESSEVPEWFEKLPKSEKVAGLWGWLTKLRNDLAHCRMSKNAEPIESIVPQAKKIAERLEELINELPTNLSRR